MVLQCIKKYNKSLVKILIQMNALLSLLSHDLIHMCPSTNGTFVLKTLTLSQGCLTSIWLLTSNTCLINSLVNVYRSSLPWDRKIDISLWDFFFFIIWDFTFSWKHIVQIQKQKFYTIKKILHIRQNHVIFVHWFFFLAHWDTQCEWKSDF